MTMTLQEAFDKAVLAVYAQGEKSMLVEDDMCAYRGDNGLKCAVGHLIADEHYRFGMESETVREAYVVDALAASGVPTALPDIAALRSLQRAHDEATRTGFRDSFWARATGVAVAHNLTMPERPA